MIGARSRVLRILDLGEIGGVGDEAGGVVVGLQVADLHCDAFHHVGSQNDAVHSGVTGELLVDDLRGELRVAGNITSLSVAMFCIAR